MFQQRWFLHPMLNKGFRREVVFSMSAGKKRLFEGLANDDREITKVEGNLSLLRKLSWV